MPTRMTNPDRLIDAGSIMMIEPKCLVQATSLNLHRAFSGQKVPEETCSF